LTKINHLTLTHIFFLLMNVQQYIILF